MPKLGLGLSLAQTRPSSGEAANPSIAFNSSGGEVASITGDIPANWVDGQTTVTSVIFANNNSVTSIGNHAIAGTQITSITIPNSVTSIGDYAFYLCTSLTTATIGNSVTSIGSNAFLVCLGLTSITIPNSVTDIGSYAFYQCSALNSVTFTPTSSVTSIGNYAFGSCAFSSITIPNSLTNIGSNAFYSLANLTSITIPSNVTSIDSEAFKGCPILATVLCYVPTSAFIGSDAFSYTASPLTIRVRLTDTSWTALLGTGQTFQGNTNVTVINNL